jgi:hypothetical protein
MRLASKTFFRPEPAVDAYGQWKSFLHLSGDGSEGKGCSLLEDIPGREVHWLSRWGLAQVDGRADFIPAHEGCVVHVNLEGVGTLSQLILATTRAFAWGPWRGVETFRPPLDPLG